MKSYLLFLFVYLMVPVSIAGPQFRGQVYSALRFIEHHQTTGEDGYDPGQWRARVTSYLPSAVGVGKFNTPFEEPTAFVAASVANVLAEIYFLAPEYNSIPPMIRKTVAGFRNYYWDELFNFYPPATYRGVQVRQPRYMYLAPHFKGFANIPPDADTTSVSYATFAYLNKIENGEDSYQSLPDSVVRALSKARDVDRKAHIYNAGQGQKNTGAFLTWLWDEDDPKMPRNLFSKPHNGTRVPFNRNDVDCVVNANVLKVLTLAKNTDGPGYQAACNHLNRMAIQKDFFYCGMYYPSRYILPYTMAEILDQGGSCLEPSRDRIISFLLKKQKRNGGWKNKFLTRPDRIQSTAWALSALAQIGDPNNPRHRQAVRDAANYLAGMSARDRHGNVYWPGEVYFAATFVARYPVVWRSSAYTTATAVKALLLAERF
ncbi:hypothetical protein ACLVWU_13720 [Bdellovibrio sp. HCB290]|uniref:hypothetical protein n=1 Tax=Bdellovibrio sp. HCB290 TaxID=3394356 RepID=UPI0039B6688E